MQVIYKILFEVRLLHEFFLTRSDGSSIFDVTPAPARDAFLQDFSNRSQRSVNSDIDYIIPDISQRLLNNYRLKLIPTYSGFKIAIAVDPTTDSGKIGYKPVAPLPPGLNIPILLVRSNTEFDRYTNGRFKQIFDSIYYLSNDNSSGANGNTVRTFPFLTCAIPVQSDTTAYEQGELSQSAGTVNAFYLDAGGVNKFAPVTGKNFLNENDRNLVAASFEYYFLPADNVKTATFIITGKDNKVVYKTTIKSDSPLQTHLLQVDQRSVNAIPSTQLAASYVYTLAVTGDNGYNKSYNIIFLNETLNSLAAWGMINIVNQPGSSPYSIIDGKGMLIARYNPDKTTVIAPPVFEICIKSRFSFWRYSNDEGSPLKDSHPAVLRLTGNNLVTLVPKSHTYAPTPVQGLALPNPKLSNPVSPEGQQIFADILVPKSDIFPSGP